MSDRAVQDGEPVNSVMTANDSVPEQPQLPDDAVDDHAATQLSNSVLDETAPAVTSEDGTALILVHATLALQM